MWKNSKSILLIHSTTIQPRLHLQHYNLQFCRSAFQSVIRNYKSAAVSETRKDSCYISSRNMKRFGSVYRYYHCDGSGGAGQNVSGVAGGGCGASIFENLTRIATVTIPDSGSVQAQQRHRNFSSQHLVRRTSYQLNSSPSLNCQSQPLVAGQSITLSTAHLLTLSRNYSSSKPTADPELDARSRAPQETGAKIFDHQISPKKGEDSSSDSESDDEFETTAAARRPSPSWNTAMTKYKHGQTDASDGVEIIYFRGLPQITIPLPSRREKCRFILKPLTNSVGDLIQMIRTEDKGVDHISILSKDGVRIASSNTIEMLMEQDFSLVINDILYEVVTPPQEKPSKEDLERLSGVRNLVGQLYAALNVDEHQLRLEREILTELEKLQVQLNPLEEKRHQLSQISTKRTTLLTWAGLGLMSVQFGILARLTWYEYSWDIMEPVTYFVTYGTAMLCYAYFVLTKQDYILPEVRDRQYLIQFHKNAKKLGLDVEKYNELKSKISVLETNLQRLRDPLALHLPPSKSRQLDLTKLDSLGADTSFINRAQQKIQELLKKTRNPS